MSYRQTILEELQALKRDTGRLMQAEADDWQQISHEKAHAFASDLKALVHDLRNTLEADEAEIERAFAGRAAQALGTAVAVGTVLGWMFRRKP